MNIKLINIGFGNIVSANRVIAIVSPESAPIKRIIQEARENGQLIGFAVRPGTNRALFNQTGLKSGDVVTEINGMALTNNQVSRQAMQSLVTASSATLTVLRGGESTTVQVAF